MLNENETATHTDAQTAAMLGASAAAWARRLGVSLGLIPTWIHEIETRLDESNTVLLLLRNIRQLVGEQLGIAEGILEFARLSAGSSVGPTSVNSMVQRVLPAKEFLGDGRGSSPTIEFDLCSDLPDAVADERLLDDVVREFIDTAVQALRGGNDLATIKIATNQVGEKIAIDISVSGLDMPPEQTSMLFSKPISQGAPATFRMGIQVSSALVNSWGGDLGLITDLNGVVTLRVILKVWKAPHSIRTTRRSIVVEDNSVWQSALSELLVARGLVVDVASSLEEVLALVTTHEYDLALLDLRLAQTSSSADASGLDVAKLLRERCPQALIVLMTGYPAESIEGEAFRSGVDEFLHKTSFTADGLNGIIDKVAMRRETAREAIRQSELSGLMYETLSMISHELRAPLAIIQRNAEALGVGALGPLDLKQLIAVEAIRSATRREFLLLNAHLDLNRIEQGIARINPRDVDLVELIREETAAHGPEADRKGIRLVSQLPDHRAFVKLDVDRFRVGLNPILDNAIKFSPNEGTVTIVVRHETDHVEVCISDQGPGIRIDELEEIMNWRGRRSGNVGQRIRASGLGLSMAKRIIELQRGKLWILTPERGGTAVYIRLPVNR